MDTKLNRFLTAIKVQKQFFLGLANFFFRCHATKGSIGLDNRKA